jgi:hypothetical protein
MARLLFVVCLLASAACAWDSPAPLQKPQPGYPCGTGWHRCNDGSCCGNGRSCGGDDPTCPVGTCCFIGELKLDGGTRD